MCSEFIDVPGCEVKVLFNELFSISWDLESKMEVVRWKGHLQGGSIFGRDFSSYIWSAMFNGPYRLVSSASEESIVLLHVSCNFIVHCTLLSTFKVF